MPTEHQPTFDEFADENLPEGFSSDVTMHTNTVNFINSLVIDEEVRPLVEVVAERRAFDSLQRMESMTPRINESIADVKKSEMVFLSKNEIKEEGHYIPVGGQYFEHKLGLLLLHQEVENGNQLGNNFYITRHVLKESPGGNMFSSITFMKFSLIDNSEDGVILVTLNQGQKKFPFFKDIKGRFSLKPDFSKVQETKYVGDKEISQKVKEYIGKRKPDPEILKNIFGMIKQAKEYDEYSF